MAPNFSKLLSRNWETSFQAKICTHFLPCCIQSRSLQKNTPQCQNYRINSSQNFCCTFAVMKITELIPQNMLLRPAFILVTYKYLEFPPSLFSHFNHLAAYPFLLHPFLSRQPLHLPADHRAGLFNRLFVFVFSLFWAASIRHLMWKPSATSSRKFGQKWSHHVMLKPLIWKAQGRHVMWWVLVVFCQMLAGKRSRHATDASCRFFTSDTKSLRK